MKYFFIFLVLFLSCDGGFVFAQKNAAKPAYAVRFKDQKLSILYQGRRHPLALGEDKIDAARINEAKILFADRKGGFTYLVLDVSGQSRKNNFERQCGAGTEANLIWVKLDSAWRVSAVDSERYESCWSPITPRDESYQITGRTLTIVIDNFRDDVSVNLTYDADQPEKGFVKQSSVLPKT
jgi:hypothetical protein